MLLRITIKVANGFCLTASLLFSLSAFAHNDTPSLLELSLEELLQVRIDTVSGFMERPDEAAASVTHIEASEWQQLGAQFNSDVFAMTPSLMLLPTTGDNVAIRGYANTLSRRGIATLIDGISVNELSFGSSQPSNEHVTLGVLDSIDVIRGPASVQYGSDAFHGVLAFKTYYRESADNNVRLVAGTEGENEVTWRSSVPYANGHYLNFALDRIAQPDSQREHWVYGTTGFNGEPRQLVREEDHELISALIKLHNGTKERWQYEFSFLHNDTDRRGMPGGAKITGYSVNDEVGTQSTNDLAHLQLISQSTPEWQQGLKLFHQAQQRIIPFEQNAAGTPLVGQAEGEITKHGAQIFNKYEAADKKRRFSVAAEFIHQEIDKSNFQLSPVGGNLVPPVPNTYEGMHRGIGSIVLQGRQTLGHWDTDIELGARSDWYSDTGTHISPSAAVIQNLPNHQVVKLIYGESFRAPVANEISGSSVISTNPNIDPEILQTVELAYSKEFDSLFLGSTIFYSEWKDGITIVPTGINTRQYQNVANSSSHGVELSAIYEYKVWLVRSDLSFIQSKDNYKHIEYSAFPETIWNTRGQLTMGETVKLFISQRFLANMTAGHNTQPNPKLPNYLRYDLGFERSFSPQLTMNIILKNVAGEKNWLPNANNGPEGIIDDPQTLLVSFSYEH